MFKNLKKYEIRVRESLGRELKKKLNTINDVFYQQLEIFNLRNDKEFSISKVINYLKINFLIKDKQTSKSFTQMKQYSTITKKANTILNETSMDHIFYIVHYRRKGNF